MTPPRFTFCPNDIIVDVPAGTGFERVTWTMPTATDESGMATLVTAEPFGETTTSTFVNVGTQGFRDIIYTFTDPSGNEAICQFQIGALGNFLVFVFVFLFACFLFCFVLFCFFAQRPSDTLVVSNKANKNSGDLPGLQLCRRM